MTIWLFRHPVYNMFVSGCIVNGRTFAIKQSTLFHSGESGCGTVLFHNLDRTLTRTSTRWNCDGHITVNGIALPAKLYECRRNGFSIRPLKKNASRQPTCARRPRAGRQMSVALLVCGWISEKKNSVTATSPVQRELANTALFCHETLYNRNSGCGDLCCVIRTDWINEWIMFLTLFQIFQYQRVV